ncbi:hypothetical protein H6B07_17055 [Mediterraneibacter glycyrrhizinilyticus]|nr:hypothetical protein [Mediterraneibacter glycyrrhizinilyticus]
MQKRGDIVAKKGTVTAVVNQKGGTGKTTTCENSNNLRISTSSGSLN